MDPRRFAGRGRRDVAVADRRRPRHPVAGRGGRGRPPLRCRAVDRPSRAGSGSASTATSRWRSPRPCPTPPPRTTSAASAPRCTRCWSTGGRCRSPGVRSGLEPADLDAAGEPVEPRSVDRDIPFQISAAAARAVQEDGGIRSAPTLLNLLQQATAVADRTELIAPVDEAAAPPSPARPRRRRRRSRGRRPPAQGPDRSASASAASILVVALIVLATVLQRHLRRRRRRLDRTSSASTRPTSEADQRRVRSHRETRSGDGLFARGRGRRARPTPARRSTATRRPCGPSTPTATPCRSPNFKNGVGLMLQLPQPTAIGVGHHRPEQHRHRRSRSGRRRSADTGVARRHHRADARRPR